MTMSMKCISGRQRESLYKFASLILRTALRPTDGMRPGPASEQHTGATRTAGANSNTREHRNQNLTHTKTRAQHRSM